MKYLPLRYAPLENELELADVADPIISDRFAAEGDTAAGVFKASNTSTLWEIETRMVKIDLRTFDNALDNSFTSHFTGGKTINFVHTTFISTLQTVVAAETQINVSRSLAKLKGFCELGKIATWDRLTF